jgi:DNA-binding MarR family transcriptional regulator
LSLLCLASQYRNTTNSGHAFFSLADFYGAARKNFEAADSPFARNAMYTRETAEFLIQTARVAQAAYPSRALGTAEWMALRFFARANPHSRKPSALADFEITTRAAVSQVVSRLERGGYVRRVQSEKDRRSYRIDVTAKGRAALQDDPIEGLIGALRSLSPAARTALHGALRDVLGALAASGKRRHFDTCRHCAYFAEIACAAEARKSECSLFHATVPSEAAALLCAHFRSRRA